MSADPASSAKQRLHELVDSVSDEQAEGLLMMVETELAPPSRPLTPGEIERIRRSLEDSGKGLGLSTDEVRRHLGIPGEGFFEPGPLTAQQETEIQRRLERIDEEDPISHEELLERLGLAD